MSGGAFEYVMAYYTGASSSFGATSNNDYAQFKIIPEDKYFDNYTSTDRLTACNGQPCYGIGYSETMWWYADAAMDMIFIDSEYPWVFRGGNENDASVSGAFDGVSNDGFNHSNTGFRSVLVLTGA